MSESKLDNGDTPEEVSEQEPFEHSAAEKSPQEDDREHLINLITQLEERKRKLNAKSKMLSAAIGYHFTQKKISRAFHQLTEVEVANYMKNYHKSLEDLWSHKSNMDQLKSDYDDKISEVSKVLEKEFDEKNQLKDGN